MSAKEITELSLKTYWSQDPGGPSEIEDKSIAVISSGQNGKESETQTNFLPHNQYSINKTYLFSMET